MTFANPLVINYAAGTKSLPRINQDSYGSEYYLREATQEFRCQIRHSKETPKLGAAVVERHGVTITRVVFAVPGVSPERTQQVLLTFRVEKTDSVTDAAEIGASLTGLINEAAFVDLGNWLN
jgi:hypothetical protein